MGSQKYEKQRRLSDPYPESTETTMKQEHTTADESQQNHVVKFLFTSLHSLELTIKFKIHKKIMTENVSVGFTYSFV